MLRNMCLSFAANFRFDALNFPNSKKDPTTRQDELRAGILDPLFKCLTENMESVIKDKSDCQILLAALEHCNGKGLLTTWLGLTMNQAQLVKMIIKTHFFDLCLLKSRNCSRNTMEDSRLFI